MTLWDGRESKGSVWHHGFESRGAEVLATYVESEMEGLGAVTRRRMGKGQVVALGAMPPPEDMMRLLLQLAGEVGIAPVAQATSNVLVAPRSGAAGEGLVVIEYEHKPGRLTLSRLMTDLLTGRRHEGTIEVPPYGVLALSSQ